MTEPHETSALDAGAAIAAGRLTSEALVRSCLDRIAAREDHTLAWIHLDPEAALAEARRRDAEPRRGPLHGVPVGVKDIIDTADMPTGYGSPIYPGNRPAWDAACVALLRAAGMVVLGKTVTTEFAVRFPGKTRNPHNREHTPGGSSSGSAASVADLMVPLGIGTQTAGSVIRPAAFCGVVGYKPTYGTIPRSGVKLLSASLDTIGVMARTVADAEAFVQAMAARPVEGFARRETPPRIGFCKSPAWVDVEPASEAAMAEAIRRVERAGAAVVDVELPPPFADMPDAHAAIMPYEACRELAHERLVHPEKISAPLTAVLADGVACTAERYDRARETQHEARRAFRGVFEQVDVLLTPSSTGEAPRDLTTTGQAVFNRIWTTVGAPCVTVPGLTGPNGLPVGVQIVGPMRGDAATLAAADWVMRALAG